MTTRHRYKTKYYRATYESSSDASPVCEIFISDCMENARTYATGENAHGRRLLDIEEFLDWRDAVPVR